MRLEADQDCLTCDYCKNIYFPEKDEDGVRVLGEAAAEACPACAIPLVYASVARERIRYCMRCRGMLIPMNTFLVLLEELRLGKRGTVALHPPDQEELNRKLDCPECHQRMDTHVYGGPGNVIIEDCSHCFLNWLDHGKLMRIAHAQEGLYDEEYRSMKGGAPARSSVD